MSRDNRRETDETVEVEEETYRRQDEKRQDQERVMRQEERHG